MARKEKNIHYIYKTTCNVTGRWYVGMHSTSNLDDGYMGSGKRLRNSIRKYGIDNHIKEILECFETRELLIEAEKLAITDDMIGDNNCMNLMGGGNGGYISKEHYLITSKIGGDIHSKKMQSDVLYRDMVLKTLLKNTNKARENRTDYSTLTFKDKNHSDKTKQLMSEKKKGLGVGETNSQFGTCWITKDGTNKKIKKEDLETYQIEGWVKGRK
jgi:hypothetical protein